MKQTNMGKSSKAKVRVAVLAPMPPWFWGVGNVVALPPQKTNERAGVMSFRAKYQMATCRQGRTRLKPVMFASSVQAVVACSATAPRVCTLVLLMSIVIELSWL